MTSTKTSDTAASSVDEPSVDPSAKRRPVPTVIKAAPNPLEDAQQGKAQAALDEMAALDQVWGRR